MKVLIFVYNTDFSIVSFIKEKFSESNTNFCKLHKVIHGNILKKRTWKNFINGLSFHKVYFYRETFRRAHPEYDYLRLPSVLIKDEHGMSILITSEEINILEDTDDCIGLVGQKLASVTTISSHID